MLSTELFDHVLQLYVTDLSVIQQKSQLALQLCKRPSQRIGFLSDHNTIHTVAHKKPGTLFLHYNSRIFCEFLHFIHRWKREWTLYRVYNLPLQLNCVFNCGNTICSSGWPWPTALPAMHSIEVVVCNFHRKSFNDDLLAIKGHRPLTYHTIIHIAIGTKETMTMHSCKLHKQISDQYLVNRLTCTLLIVFLNNNKLLKLTIEGGKLFHKPATRSVKKMTSHIHTTCV